MGGDREDEGGPQICRSCQSQRSHLRCRRDGNQERSENHRGLVASQQEMVSPALQPQHSLRLDIRRGYRQTSETNEIIHINPRRHQCNAILYPYLYLIL